MRFTRSLFAMGVLAVAFTSVGLQQPLNASGYAYCLHHRIINNDCPTGCAYEPKWCVEGEGCELLYDLPEICSPGPPDSGTGQWRMGHKTTTENRYSGPYCTYDMSRTTIDETSTCYCCKPSSIGV